MYFSHSKAQSNLKTEKVNEASKRTSYGKYVGYYKWDLAVTWFQVSNDGFFNIYGFNFVPKGRLFTEAREFVHNK